MPGADLTREKPPKRAQRSSGPASSTSTSTSTSTATSSTVGSVLSTATTAEQDARATYDAVTEKVGDVQPFTTVADEEGRHIHTLESLASHHGVALPAWPISGKAPPPTLKEVCQDGVSTRQVPPGSA